MPEPYKIYIAVYLVLTKGNEVLLLRRQNTAYQDGNYSLVSGHLNGGETAREGMIREAREEAGIALRPEDLQVVYINHRFSPAREYIDVYLAANKWEGEVTNMEPEKCSDLDWFPMNDLPANFVPDVRLALENIKAGKFYGEFGWESRRG